MQEVYTLVFAALLLVWGRLADRYGRRLLFVTGAAAFAAASVLAAFSQSGPELIGSRVLQGIAGAMMLPTSLSLLNAGFRGRDRAIAFAVWGSTIGGARPAARRLAHNLLFVAVGLRHQRPDRPGRRRRDPPARAGVQGGHSRPR